ncbi:MAG TPA: hypothetical protein V6D18_02850 [Thermosynechococcaceae cyanobacterium]
MAGILAPGKSYRRWKFVGITAEAWLDQRTLTFEYCPTLLEWLQGKHGTLRVVMARQYLADPSDWELQCFEAAFDWIEHHSAQTVSQWRCGLAEVEMIRLPPKWTKLKFVRDGQLREIDLAEIVKLEDRYVRECPFALGSARYLELTLQDGTFLKLNLSELAAVFPEIAELHRTDYVVAALSHLTWNRQRKFSN